MQTVLSSSTDASPRLFSHGTRKEINPIPAETRTADQIDVKLTC